MNISIAALIGGDSAVKLSKIARRDGRFHWLRPGKLAKALGGERLHRLISDQDGKSLAGLPWVVIGRTQEATYRLTAHGFQFQWSRFLR